MSSGHFARRSIRAFSGDNHSVADGEGGFTTDDSDAQDAAMKQDGESGWTTAEDEASGPDEAGMLADGDGGITTDDEADAETREKAQKALADLFIWIFKHMTNHNSGSTNSVNIPEDKSAIQVLRDWLASRVAPPFDPIVMAKVESWADHYNKSGVLTPEAAAALGASTDVDSQTQARYLALVISSIIKNYDAWSWWIDALKNSSGK